MPWKEVSIVSQRKHFYYLWKAGNHTMSELCRIFGISRKTGYKWINRSTTGDVTPFEDRSTRPHHSPNKTPDNIENAVVELRKQHPAWGGRKLKKVLETKGLQGVPAASTITTIIKRRGLFNDDTSSSSKLIRFEHDTPNALWQMDFKGHFPLSQGRCHPLTILDDHSRFNLLLKACANETTQSVKQALTETFERYGLPDRMTMDNGSPWGNKHAGGYTKLTVWLMDLGIRVSHSRPYHPQTQGKDERFHRTLKHEVLKGRHFKDMAECQHAFDEWRDIYNYVRPHEALNLEVPTSRYSVSHRSYQEWNTGFIYDQEDLVRKVNRSGAISFRSQKCYLGEAFSGRTVAIKRTIETSVYEVYYRHQRIAKIENRN